MKDSRKKDFFFVQVFALFAVTVFISFAIPLYGMLPPPLEVEENEIRQITGDTSSVLEESFNDPTEEEREALNLIVDSPEEQPELERRKRPGGLALKEFEVSDIFKVQPGLIAQVEFWKKIFGRYHSNQMVIHDTNTLVIYDVIEVEEIKGSRLSHWRKRHLIEQRIKAAKEKYKKILKSLAHKEQNGKLDPGGLSPDELRIFELYSHIDDRDKFKHAQSPHRFRMQVGMRNTFIRSLQVAGAFIKQMETIFKEQDMPVELSRIPFLESSFNIHARSHLGAVGVWQFMRSTGRHFLRIDDAVDERKDPILSTYGAAGLLRQNYQSLGTWPLAITAYNHGRMGIKRAVEITKTADLAEIIRQYNGRRFGFASKNFYAEFLAVLELESNYKKYFGELDVDEPIEFDEVKLDKYLTIDTLEKYTGLMRAELIRYNPAFTTAVTRGDLRVPMAYPIRIPKGTLETVLAQYSEIPDNEKFVAQRGRIYHQVSRGETLSTIAGKYQTTINAIASQNALPSKHRIRAGQVLVIHRGRPQ